MVDPIETGEELFWYSGNTPGMAEVQKGLQEVRKDSLRGDAPERVVVIECPIGTPSKTIAKKIQQTSRRAKTAFYTAFGKATGDWGEYRGGTLYVEGVPADHVSILSEKAKNFDVRLILGVAPGEGDSAAQTCNGLAVKVPTLVDRSGDLLTLARAFATRAFQVHGKNFTGFSPEAEQAMLSYGWPGNDEELFLVCERAALLFNGEGAITAHFLTAPLVVSRAVGGPKLELVQSPFSAPGAAGMGGYMEMKKEWTNQFEKNYLSAALERHGGNVSAAAREAKLDRSNFLRLLRRYGITAQVFRKAA